MVATVVHLSAQALGGTDVVATPTPELTWRTETDVSPWVQSRAELELALTDGETRHVMLGGADSVLVPWPFAPLTDSDRGQLRVRVTGSDEEASAWSDSLPVVAGFLPADGWVAAPVGLAEPAAPATPGLLRTEFAVQGEVQRAVLYAAAVGVYQIAVNGTDVDDQVLKPGWTPYALRRVHQSTDVTGLLRPGRNAVGIRLAGGWATEQYGFRGHEHRVYADQPSVTAQIVITFTDGRREVVRTDTDWRTSPGPILGSGIYPGEAYDARREQPGWSEPGFDDSGWRPAARAEDGVTPEAQTSPPVRRVTERGVEQVLSTPSGATVVDFGQNLVGRLRIRVSGPAGTEITLRHAEVLEHGELGTRPLRAAAATDTYILRGGPEEVWEPEFTFHGFRYAQVDGWPGTLEPDAVTAVVLHSDMERTGWFSSSDPRLDQLHENIVWGMRGNFLALPTDCPQRDERLGWTGDIQVFAPTASFLYDCRAFLASWLRDLAVEQRNADGVVPFVVPNVLGEPPPAAAWGDAATVVPLVLHERFADLETLREQFPSMRAWTDVILDRAGDRHLWEGGFQFGDWLDPTAPPDNAADAKTSPDIIASAYAYRSADLTARAAELLGDAPSADHYRRQADLVREAFNAEYLTPAGRMMSDAQTAYALAIMFDIAPVERHPVLGERLARLVTDAGFRIGTGFVGTPIICDALTRTGHLDVAAQLLLQTECPSWLYPVTMGATTVWERWDSMLPDGSINPGEMTSFNHYALGAVGDWLHRTVAGLAPAEPGYRRLRIAPRPIPGLDFAEARHRTPYGLAACRWERSGDDLLVSATVPPGTTAEVLLPDGQTFEVGSGEHRWTAAVSETVVASTPVSTSA